jgi:hypothetical protein
MMMFEMESRAFQKRLTFKMAKGKPFKMERFKNQSCINGWYFQCQFGLQLGIANKSNNICLGTLTSESNHHVTVTYLCTFDCSAKGRTRTRTAQQTICSKALRVPMFIYIYMALNGYWKIKIWLILIVYYCMRINKYIYICVWMIPNMYIITCTCVYYHGFYIAYMHT